MPRRSPWLSRGVFGAALLTAILTAIAVGLGIWQLGAWQQERELNSTDRSAMTPVPIAEVMGPDDVFPGDASGRPVTLSGTWVPDSTVLVPDRVRDGVEGWWVATAVAPADQDASIYVVRDFTADPDRVPAEPTGAMDDTVWLEPTEAATHARDTQPDDDRISAMRTVELLHHVPGDLYSGFAVMDERDRTPVKESSVWTGLQNFFYAFEWWVFGGFVVFMFIRFLWELKQRYWADVAEQLGVGQPEGEPAPAQLPADGHEARASTRPIHPQGAVPAATTKSSTRDRLNDVSGVLTRYRVMANIVGVLLIVILLIGIPLKYFTGGPMWGLVDSTPNLFLEGGTANEIGDWITHYLGVAHGWLYMIFLFAAFHLAMRCRWGFGFSALVLLCGTIPIVSFWAEHRGVKAARAAFPEELGAEELGSEERGAETRGSTPTPLD